MIVAVTRPAIVAICAAIQFTSSAVDTIWFPTVSNVSVIACITVAKLFAIVVIRVMNCLISSYIS